MKRPTQGPTEAEIARSQASIAAVLGAGVMDDPLATADPSPPLTDGPTIPIAELADHVDRTMGLSTVDFVASLANVGWHSMATARKDGKPLWLRGPSGEVVEATWRQSRKWVATLRGGQWETFFAWTAINSGGAVPWEPVGWRLVTGAPHP